MTAQELLTWHAKMRFRKTKLILLAARLKLRRVERQDAEDEAVRIIYSMNNSISWSNGDAVKLRDFWNSLAKT